MRDTILFDLDGTLLPMEFKAFMKLYFGAMGQHFKEWLDPMTLIDNVNKATEVTIKTNDGRSNETIFMEHFQSLIEEDINTYKDHWVKFYDSLFVATKDATWQSPEIPQAIAILKDKGYRLGIATNPLLPLQANLHRIAWAGLNKDDFSYISSFEQNAYCKPFVTFFEEVCQHMNVKASQCYMIGNDVLEDGVAQTIGMKTYMITDCLINDKNIENTSDYSGTYKDFLDFVKELPYVK
jgi:FMN phosphatase YigB (HAD superfamily)